VVGAGDLQLLGGHGDGLAGGHVRFGDRPAPRGELGLGRAGRAEIGDDLLVRRADHPAQRRDALVRRGAAGLGGGRRAR
jgi:hypothetical protein